MQLTPTRWIYVSILLFASMFAAATQQLEAAAPLNERTASLIRRANLGNARVSVMAVDMADEKVLIDLDADLSMIPASNMKLLTSAAAIDLMGEDFVFRTQLAALAPEQPGGRPDLLLTGSGDPALGDPYLLEQHGLHVEQLLGVWVDAVKATGMQHFSRLIVDDRIFDDQYVHPSWPMEQLNRWYCAQVAGINFHANCLMVTAVPGPSAGSRPNAELSPDAPFVRTNTQARTVGSNQQDTFWISRRHGTNEITFHGNVRHRSHQPVPVTMHDPGMFLGRLLWDRLSKAGIQVDHVERADSHVIFTDPRVLHVVQTTLPLVLNRVNSDSQNMYAEALVKYMGQMTADEPGSWDNGAQAMRQALAGRIGDLVWDLKIADGSGMSRDNRVTARAITALLAAMWLDKDVWPTFRDSLSFGGLDETGGHVGEGSLARHRDRVSKLSPGDQLFAKTGYIARVYTLSGYLVPAHTQDEPQHVIAFSILVNDYTAPVTGQRLRQLQGEILALLAGTSN